MAEEVVKIKLVKKSGPGEIMGEIERESINGVVSFSGLQFDQPGEYVISAVPSSADVETKDFTITVASPVIEEQEERGEEEKVEGSRPIIAQIDKPTYLLKPIEFERNERPDTNNEYGKNLGIIPFFWWMGYQIAESDIRSLGLYYDGLIPKVNIIFTDSQGIMKRDGFPLDNTKFEIFLNSGSENLKSVHLKFKVENFQENKKGSYTLLGTLDLDNFYKPSFKSYTGTSFEALRKLSKELGLGFNSNISNTNDSMKWVNTGKLPFEFMSQIISHSYISDDSFLMGYIDFYYSFNYVDVEKEWKRDISEDIGIVSQGLAGATTEPPKGDEDKLQRLILSNDASQRGGNLYIDKYTLNNNSTSQSTKKGQFRIIKYYDTFKKSFLIFNIDSLTSEGDKTVILKGAPGDKTELDENYRTEYKGKIDSENTHSNYVYAQIQNKINLENLVRITVDLELPDANFNLYRYQKIEIRFTNPSQTPAAPEDIQTRISGEWIIIDISYVWASGKMRQTLKCARKELGKLPEEIANQTTEGKKEENIERNENPTDPPPAIPNSVYNVGDAFITIDKNGKRFKVTITEVSSNGIEVVANVEEIPGPVSQTEPLISGTGGTASGTASETTTSGTSSTP